MRDNLKELRIEATFLRSLGLDGVIELDDGSNRGHESELEVVEVAFPFPFSFGFPSLAQSARVVINSTFSCSGRRVGSGILVLTISS